MRATSRISDDTPKTISHISSIRFSVHMLARGQPLSSNAAPIASKPVINTNVTPPPNIATSSRIRAKGQ